MDSNISKEQIGELLEDDSLIDFFETLISNKQPDAHIPSEGGFITPLHLFSHMGHKGALSVLFLMSADPDSKDSHGDRPLKFAILNGNLEIVKMLLDYGADVNAQFGNGETGLHVAFMQKKGEIANLLLQYGADLTIRTDKGITPKDIDGYNLLKQVGYI